MFINRVGLVLVGRDYSAEPAFLLCAGTKWRLSSDLSFWIQGFIASVLSFDSKQLEEAGKQSCASSTSTIDLTTIYRLCMFLHFTCYLTQHRKSHDFDMMFGGQIKLKRDFQQTFSLDQMFIAGMVWLQ